MRLQKYLSRAGVASRRASERLILAGRVQVNGETVLELGTSVDPETDRISVDGRPVELATPRWVALHKPTGVLTTRSDPHGGRTVYDVVPPEMRGLAYVGRLDRDTEGLLLFTNEGDLAHALLHPSRGVEREYQVWVVGRPDRTALNALRTGVMLDDGMARAHQVELIERGREGSLLRLVLTEGRKREVRRMLDAVGHPARGLRRVRFGPVELGDLAPGAVRPLSDREVAALRASV